MSPTEIAVLIYAPSSRPLMAESPALAIAEPDSAVATPAPDGLAYLLEVRVALDVIDVWSSWRSGRLPTIVEQVAAIAYYADNDAYPSGKC
jgi:hypothetical protein